jgi:hypothetical protein
MSRHEDRPMFNMEIPAQKRFATEYIKNQRGTITIEVTHPRSRKTNAQMAYLYGVVYPRVSPMLAEFSGEAHDVHRTHLFLKDKFLRRLIVNRDTGVELGFFTPSLADLDVAECSEYIEKIILFAAENGTEIPPAAQYEITGNHQKCA